jgi:hypothetical protein
MNGLLRCGLFCCCLLAAFCEDYRVVAARQAAEDDAKCLSYGAKQGDPAYVHSWMRRERKPTPRQVQHQS